MGHNLERLKRKNWLKSTKVEVRRTLQLKCTKAVACADQDT